MINEEHFRNHPYIHLQIDDEQIEVVQQECHSLGHEKVRISHTNFLEYN